MVIVPAAATAQRFFMRTASVGKWLAATVQRASGRSSSNDAVSLRVGLQAGAWPATRAPLPRSHGVVRKNAAGAGPYGSAPAYTCGNSMRRGSVAYGSLCPAFHAAVEDARKGGGGRECEDGSGERGR